MRTLAIDPEMARLFFDARDHFKDKSRQRLVAEQRAWLREREGCRKSSGSSACLQSIYEIRIMQLGTQETEQDEADKKLAAERQAARDTAKAIEKARTRAAPRCWQPCRRCRNGDLCNSLPGIDLPKPSAKPFVQPRSQHPVPRATKTPNSFFLCVLGFSSCKEGHVPPVQLGALTNRKFSTPCRRRPPGPRSSGAVCAAAQGHGELSEALWFWWWARQGIEPVPRTVAAGDDHRRHAQAYSERVDA